MNVAPRLTISHREELSEALIGALDHGRFKWMPLDQALQANIPPRGALIGTWGTREGDPFADFMVVNDGDLADTQAWLSSYLNSVAPVTQWCRVWPLSDFQNLPSALEMPNLGPLLAPWVGATIAECSVQGNSNINLRELSGTAALTSASFSAGRALAVWGPEAQLFEVARRHDEISSRLRDVHRPIGAARMVSLWWVLSISWIDRPPSDERALAPFREVMQRIVLAGSADAGVMQESTRMLSNHFDLPELVDCGQGPQAQRVEAIDRLAARLTAGPKSGAIEAIMGFAASLVDPGAAVLPELLRRYVPALPMAQVWAGAFAGAWSPIRVLGDFQGLGRIVARELVKPSDLFSKPEADIAFDELSRWVGKSARGSVPVRGMVARTLNVELLPGVTAPFPIGRSEQARPDNAGSAAKPAGRQPGLPLSDSDVSSAPIRSLRAPATIAELIETINLIGRRLALLEEVVQDGTGEKAGKSSARVRTPSRKAKGSRL